MTEKDIKYGNVTLDEKDFDPKYTKVRITTLVDLDVLEAIKKMAEEKGTKYQTLLNDLLRNAVTGDEIEKIKKRLEEIEKKIA